MTFTSRLLDSVFNVAPTGLASDESFAVPVPLSKESYKIPRRLPGTGAQGRGSQHSFDGIWHEFRVIFFSPGVQRRDKRAECQVEKYESASRSKLSEPGGGKKLDEDCGRPGEITESCWENVREIRIDFSLGNFFLFYGISI